MNEIWDTMESSLLLLPPSLWPLLPSSFPFFTSLEIFLSTFEALLCFIGSIIGLFWGHISQIKPLTKVNIGFQPSLLCLSLDLLRFSAQNLLKIDLLSYARPNMTYTFSPATSCPAIRQCFLFFGFSFWFIFPCIFLFLCVLFLDLFVFLFSLI